jgi:hypothetical protein
MGTIPAVRILANDRIPRSMSGGKFARFARSFVCRAADLSLLLGAEEAFSFVMDYERPSVVRKSRRALSSAGIGVAYCAYQP